MLQVSFFLVAVRLKIWSKKTHSTEQWTESIRPKLHFPQAFVSFYVLMEMTVIRAVIRSQPFFTGWWWYRYNFVVQLILQSILGVRIWWRTITEHCKIISFVYIAYNNQVLLIKDKYLDLECSTGPQDLQNSCNFLLSFSTSQRTSNINLKEIA